MTFQIANFLKPHILNDLRKLGIATGIDYEDLRAIEKVIDLVFSGVSNLDANCEYNIGGYLVGKTVTSGSTYDNIAVFFEDVLLLQLNESCEGWSVTFVNVDLITRSEIIKTFMALAT